MEEHPKCGLFYECGMGKTLTSLAAVVHNRDVRLPVLVIAPMRVCRHVWPDEVAQWGFRMTVEKAIGTAKRRRKALEAHADLTTVNPEGLKHVVTWCKELGRVPFRSIIVDESTYFKNNASARWKYAKKLCDEVDYVTILTGTPIAGRGHIDIWAQMALLGEANPFGTWSQFTSQHFYFDHFNRAHLRKGHDAEINGAIAPVVLRKSVEEIDMPNYVELDIVVDMPPVARREYKDMQLEENSYAPLRTLASGFAYDKHWSGEIHTRWVHAAKLDALQGLKEEVGNEPLLVFANFTAGIDAIVEKFGAPAIDGRTKAANAARYIEQWNAGQLPVMVLHPRAAGHGLNLQKGPGRRVVWFDLPDSGESYIQACARIHRSGQKASTVFVHRIIAEDSIDTIIAALLTQKILSEQTLLAAVRANN